MTALHHFYHVYADGDWHTPVRDHFDALTRFGLLNQLTSLHLGFVGTRENIGAVHEALASYTYETVAESREGWEQETLQPLWEFTQYATGLVSYAHTKGSANFAEINNAWRRSMEYYCYVDWQKPAAALTANKYIAGCHWHCGGPSSIPGFGTGGMFGGNYWWTRCELLRRNVPPGRESRYAAEHWLGQLSEVMPITTKTICDLNPTAINYMYLHDKW